MRDVSVILLSLTTLVMLGCERDRVDDSVPSAPRPEAHAPDAGEADASHVAADARAGVVEGRDPARLVLEEYCGRCHIGTYDTAIPGALAVFDLSETDWAGGLTQSQMQSIDARLTDMLDPDHEPMVPGQPTDIDVEERDAVRAYLVRLGAELPAGG